MSKIIKFSAALHERRRNVAVHKFNFVSVYAIKPFVVKRIFKINFAVVQSRCKFFFRRLDFKGCGQSFLIVVFAADLCDDRIRADASCAVSAVFAARIYDDFTRGNESRNLNRVFLFVVFESAVLKLDFAEFRFLDFKLNGFCEVVVVFVCYGNRC